MVVQKQTEGCETSISGCFVLFLSQCPKLLIDLMYVHNTYYFYIVAVVAAHKPPMQFQLMLQNDLYCPHPNYSMFFTYLSGLKTMKL